MDDLPRSLFSSVCLFKLSLAQVFDHSHEYYHLHTGTVQDFEGNADILPPNILHC
jgi:hypothetical protein